MHPLPTIHESQLQKDNSITHAAAAARNLDAAIPLRSAQTELQNTIAQRQQRRGKVTLNPHSDIERANRTGIDGEETTPASVAHASQLFSATEPPFTQKKHCLVQTLAFKSHP